MYNPNVKNRLIISKLLDSQTAYFRSYVDLSRSEFERLKAWCDLNDFEWFWDKKD